MQTGLFSKELLKDPSMIDVALLVGGFEKWNDDLKTRRDPAAHRIPLSVPPSALNAADQKKAAEIDAEIVAARSEANELLAVGGNALPPLEKVSLLYSKLRRIGTFLPVFVHHPSEGAMKIYPTVPEDIGTMIRITRDLSVLIRTRLAKA